MPPSLPPCADWQTDQHPINTHTHDIGTIGAVQLDAALLACQTLEEASSQLLPSSPITTPTSSFLFGGALCSSPTLGSVASPLTFFYGHDNLGKNPELYKRHVE